MTPKTKKPWILQGLFVRQAVHARLRGALGLDRLDVRSLLALRANLDVERHTLVFLQRLEAVCADFREVCEQVVAAGVGRDEAKTLCIIEPFDNTGFHVSVSLKI
ncbi:conserved hypothetical protein [Paraburkholderia tropica]